MNIARYWGSKPVDVVKQVVKEMESDIIVDPFGGSGVIVRAALEAGKRALYIDINPYAWLVTHVSLAGAPVSEYENAVKHVLELAKSDKSSRRCRLRHDHLRYSNGRFFWKRRTFNRVSEFFTVQNAIKLFRILKAIDAVECSTNTKLALYLTFCSAAYRSSLMNRDGAGSWGVPCYWVPPRKAPRDPFTAFNSAAKRFSAYFRRTKGYSIAYTREDFSHHDVLLLIGNALTYRYNSDWSLFTDPPFMDEIQYMELSYFYWAWLKESRLPGLIARLLGKSRIQWRFSAEMVVNPVRGVTVDRYMEMLRSFVKRTRCMREKILLFHAEEDIIVDMVVSIAKSEWHNIAVEKLTMKNQRQIGPRGSKEYILIISKC